MLSEEEAICILESNQMMPKVLKLGSQKNIKAKLPDGYSFIIRPDESKPGHLCACLNHNASGIVTTWNEINQKSLVLAIKNVQGLLDITLQEVQPEVKFEDIKLKAKLASERWFIPLTILLSFLLVGVGYFAVNRLIIACNQQRSEIPILRH